MTVYYILYASIVTSYGEETIQDTECSRENVLLTICWCKWSRRTGVLATYFRAWLILTPYLVTSACPVHSVEIASVIEGEYSPERTHFILILADTPRDLLK